MRPYTKIIQIQAVEDGGFLICLCENGSVWQFDRSNDRWTLITEMDGSKYV